MLARSASAYGVRSQRGGVEDMKTPGDKIRENLAAIQRNLQHLALAECLGWLAIGGVLGLSLGILLGRWG